MWKALIHDLKCFRTESEQYFWVTNKISKVVKLMMWAPLYKQPGVHSSSSDLLNPCLRIWWSGVYDVQIFLLKQKSEKNVWAFSHAFTFFGLAFHLNWYDSKIICNEKVY